MVTPYAVTFKLFQACFLIMTASVVALWPMYAQASGQGDWHWMQRTYDSSVAVQIMLGGLIWIAGILFAEPVIAFFARDAYAGHLVAFALGGYIYVCSFFGANAGLINGLNPSTAVVALGLGEAALNIGLSLALIRYLGIGGVALGTCLASLAINSWAPPLYIRKRTNTKIVLNVGPVVTHTASLILFVVAAMFASFHLAGTLRSITSFAIMLGYLISSLWITLPTLTDVVTAAFPKLRSARRRLTHVF
jgi:O-antigen/teichoic acid export membrane protein